MAKVPEDEELIAALADLRSVSVFGVKNLRQAVLQQHPDWLVGEKRVKRLNRVLIDSNGFLLDVAQEPRFQAESGNEDNFAECDADMGWEDVLAEHSVEKDWVLVEIPSEL